jgi:hypothetical protein
MRRTTRSTSVRRINTRPPNLIRASNPLLNKFCTDRRENPVAAIVSAMVMVWGGIQAVFQPMQLLKALC